MDNKTHIELDLATFETLFKSNFKLLCSFAFKYVKDLDTSKEIVHDVFVKLWENRAEIDQSKSIKSFLFTAVSNRCKNWIRDHKKFVKGELSEEAGFDFSARGMDTAEYSELENKVNESVNQLPEKCREIFLLNRYEGLKYQEIADKLDISIKTVENQMGKALKVLRESLKEYIISLIIIILGIT